MSSPCQDKVSIFWDFENCQPSSGVDACALTENIRRIAHRFGQVTSFKAYIDLALLSRNARPAAFRAQLQASGVLLIDTPHHNKKEVADKVMIVDMMAFALENQPPATVILITGDSDFAYLVSVLRFRLYRVVLITPRTLSTVKTLACVTLDWESDILPPKPVQHILPPKPVQQKALTWPKDDLALIRKSDPPLTAPRRSWEAAQADIRLLIPTPQARERRRSAEITVSMNRGQYQGAEKTVVIAVKRPINKSDPEVEAPSKRLCRRTPSVEEISCPPERDLRAPAVLSRIHKTLSVEKLCKASERPAPTLSVATDAPAVSSCRLSASASSSSTSKAPVGSGSGLTASVSSSFTAKAPIHSGSCLSSSVSSSCTSKTLVESSSRLSASVSSSSTPIKLAKGPSSGLPLPGIPGQHCTPRKLPSFRKYSDPAFQSNTASSPSKSPSRAGSSPFSAPEANYARRSLPEKNDKMASRTTAPAKDVETLRNELKASSSRESRRDGAKLRRSSSTILRRNEAGDERIPREFVPLTRALEYFRLTGENCADPARIEKTIEKLSQDSIEKIYQEANVRKLRQYLELAVLAGVAVKTRGKSCSCLSMHLYLHPKWHGFVSGMNYSRFLKRS